MYPEHTKIVFRGGWTLGTDETWSHSHATRPMRAGDALPGTPSFSFDDLKAAWTAMAQACLTTYAELREVRIYRIGPNGKMVGNPAIQVLTGTLPKGGVTGTLFPPQVALAITTEAPNRGPARLGRYYLPGVGFTLQEGLRMSVSDQTKVLGAQRTYLLAIRDAVRMDLSPDTVDAPVVNVSPRGNGNDGTIQDVTRVRVGRVYDTLRSRRRSLEEDYKSVAL